MKNFVKKLVVLAVVFGLAVSAFGFAPTQTRTAQAATTSSARVRVAHLSPDAPNVDVYVNSSKVLTNVAYTTVSNYLTVPAGSTQFKVFATGADPNSTPVISATANLTAYTDYTVAATGKLANIQATVYTDTNTAPASGKVRLRVIHASPDTPAIDVALKGGPVVISNLAFPNASSYLEIPAGVYSFEVRPTGTTTVALAINNVDLQAGKTYSVIAEGLSGGTPALTAALQTDAGSARVRVAHLSPDAPNVDVYANGAKILSNVAFGTVSDYLTVGDGNYEFKVFPAGANPSGTPAIDAQAVLTAGKDYTVAATGKLASIQATVLTDNNQAPAPGNVRLRVFHASPDTPAIDVALKGGSVVVSNLSFPNASQYLEIPAGTYSFEVRPTGTTTVALPINNVALQAGKTYTVIAEGFLNGTPALTAALQTDATVAQVRVAHLSPDAPNVDVYANNTKILTNTAYTAVTGYLPVQAGNYEFKVFPTGANPNSTPAIDAQAYLAGGSSYTVAATGKLANIQATVLTDTNTAPAPGFVRLRVFHASPNTPAIDVALKGGPVVISNLAFPNASNYLQIPAGTYSFEVRPTGTTTVALPINNVTLQAGKTYTVIAEGLLNGNPALTAALQTDATSYAYPLPILSNGANGVSTFVTVQNSGALAANLSVSYYSPNSALLSTQTNVLQLHGQLVLPTTAIASGNQGSAVVVSDQPLNVLVTNGVSGTSGTSAGAYNVSSSTGSTLYDPIALNGNFGFTTTLFIYNTSIVTSTGTIQYYDQNGNAVASDSFSLPPFTGQNVSQAGKAGLNNNTSYWAVISGTAGSQLVAQVTERSSNNFLAIFEATTSPSQQIFAPTAYNNAINGFNTGFALANTGSSAANVTITYYNAASGTISGTQTLSIPANGIGSSYTPASGLPSGFVGSAIISSTQPLAVTVNEQGIPGSGTYAALPQAGQVVGLPAVANGFAGFVTGSTALNASSQAIQVTLQYYDSNGNAIGTPQVQTVQPGASVLNYQGASNSGLPANSLDTAVLSSNVPNSLVVTVNAAASGLFYTYTEPTP